MIRPQLVTPSHNYKVSRSPLTLFSFKNFYLGWDDINFFDVSVHIGKIRLECGGFVPARYKHQPQHEPPEKGHHER